MTHVHRVRPMVLAGWAAIVAAAALALIVGLRSAPAATQPAAGVGGRVSAGVVPAFSTPLFIPPVLTSASVNLTMEQTCEQILDGACTSMWTYGGTYPGPTIRRPAGQTTDVTFTNNLPVAAGQASVHNHGNHSAPEHDGSPHNYLIPNGDARTYTYTGTENGADERGATQFYHDHVMDVTGRNVWNGLSGFYIIDDPADPATLPSGAYDIPLMIADRRFDAGNQIPYTFDTNGVGGPTNLVNGVYQPFLEVGDRKYRFRLLDNANARLYALTLSNGASFTQIGTESGLLPAPVSRSSLLISPAERVDVVIDFAGLLGQTLYLRDAITGTDLLQFRVTSDVVDTSSVPPALRELRDLGTPVQSRSFSFSSGGGQWTINGQPFDHERIDAQPLLGTTEEWTFVNATGAPHVIHVHDVDQQCVTRNGGACPAWELEKESWLLLTGQSVTVRLKFTDHTGPYLIHCHILEHEDDGMMGQFEVVAPETPTPSATPTTTATPVATATDTPSVPTATSTATPPPDGDGDGIADPADNCPAVSNADQRNTDADPLRPWPPGPPPASPPPYDATRARGDPLGDACDSDDDNDALTDTDELAAGTGAGACPTATAALSPLEIDSDGDRVHDGAECALGSDPASATSLPPSCAALSQPDSDGDRLCDPFETAITSNPLLFDSDGDGFSDGVEYRGYGSSPVALDSDSDGCTDAAEIASVDMNRIVNATDLLLVALQYGRSDRPVHDVDRNSLVNASDLLAVARRFNQFC